MNRIAPITGQLDHQQEKTKVRTFIKAVRGPSDAIGLGYMCQFLGMGVPDGWLECAGQDLLIEDFSELFAVIGRTFGPKPTILAPKRRNWIQRLLMLNPGLEEVVNPEYNEKTFRLPDLRDPVRFEVKS